MSKNKKLTKEEFSKLEELSVIYQKATMDIGRLEVKKSALMSTIPAIQSDLFKFEDELQAKYGEGKVNPKTLEMENAN
jgi:hypothetical protein